MDDDVIYLEQLAKEAGREIMKYYKTTAEVCRKADGSPVTIADKSAEDLILKRLAEHFPNIPAIGEESVNYAEEHSFCGRFWLVDPLDGTSEFVAERDEFTVNIALMQNGVPILGVIYAPAEDILYLGGSILGCSYKVLQGKRLKLPITRLDKPTAAISRTHPTRGQEEKFLKLLQDKYDLSIRRTGSSLKFCMIAEGSASLYFRSGTTMFWDTAAGHAIVKASGGAVKEWKKHGEELTYRDNSLKNPAFIAVNPHWEALVEELL
ncbi:MAG: 3'(2'),5'-bisphosphate nucleotidase CysQ [Deferribacteraceae bacterium]|jgi:3'(2'), 5'-bisphosphate nucleotidase|nr:3'(2'),5'-bisphosphate nucleotidase CysQ [Deferribacteraceae bacterium]